MKSNPSRSLSKSAEEEDHFRRSKKKVRSWDDQDTESMLDGDEEDRPPSPSASYKAKLLNLFGEEVPDKEALKAIQEKECGVAKVSNQVAGLEIPLSDEEWQAWSQPWQKTLVAKVLGKSVSFRTLEGYMHRRWMKNGAIKIVDMADGYFLVYFSSEMDYNHALYEGPWVVQDHYLIVQRWRPFFLQSAERESKVAVWLKIPKLPFELYNAQFLWRIGSSLGSMLKIDKTTSIHSRGRFVRICVEIDLAQPLQSHIIIRGHKLFLEYEGLHLICFQCGKYGHRADQCVSGGGVAMMVQNSNPGEGQMIGHDSINAAPGEPSRAPSHVQGVPSSPRWSTSMMRPRRKNRKALRWNPLGLGLG